MDGDVEEVARGHAEALEEAALKHTNALLEGALHGDTDTLAALLAAPCPVVRTLAEALETEHPVNGASLLNIAAREGHTATVAFLIKQGANVETSTKSRVTPLAAAAARGHLSVVAELVKRGNAIVDAVGARGATALYGACYNGHLDVVRYLVDKCSANPHVLMKSKTSPLLTAAVMGHTNVVEYLVSIGCNVEVVDHQNATPLFVACRYGHACTAEALARHWSANIHHRTDKGMTPVIIACRYGYLDIVKKLVEWGASLADVTASGMTTMAATAEGGFVAVIMYLLDQGIDVDAPDNHHATPLMHAARGGHYTAAKCLVDVGHADIHHQLRFGLTVLGVAASSTVLDNASAFRMSTARRTLEALAIRGAVPNPLDIATAHVSLKPFLCHEAAHMTALQIATCCRLEDEMKWLLATTDVEIERKEHTFYLLASRHPSPWGVPIEMYGALGKRVARLARQALLPWAPPRRKLYHPRFRECVRTVVFVAFRLATSDTVTVVPHTPIEMWLYVLSFIRRSDYKSDVKPPERVFPVLPTCRSE